ncbi:RNA methyltransferase [Clostridium ihumii]|uniref:RNA methyltransferase n=1 Tax=Clostridium ihumii TaxID=1470356 RepID=UPI00058FD946|nr:RNA methyltransferase [Clostridium ihumii]
MEYKFEDLNKYTLEEKEKIVLDRYKSKVIFAGKQHGVIKKINNLNNNTKPNPEKLAVLEGIWGLDLILKNNIKIKYFIFCIEDIHTIEAQEILHKCINIAEEVFVVSKKVFLSISEKGNPQGLLAVCYMPNKTFDDINLKRNNLVIVLDGLEIPGNVGTIIRSADATNIDAIIINNRKTRMNHPKLIRSSMGSCLSMKIIDSTFEETKKWLDKNKFQVVLTDTRAEKEYYELKYDNRVAIVMGSEKYGISREWYDTKYTGVSIPMLGECDSLNVGVATTIILYEASLKNKSILNRKEA